MFWIGIILTLAVGLLSLGLLRASIRKTLPQVAERHLDLLLLTVFLAGLAMTIIQHVRQGRENETLRANIERLEQIERTIGRFEAQITAVVVAQWSEQRPKPGLREIGSGRHPYLTILHPTRESGKTIAFYPSDVRVSGIDTRGITLEITAEVRPGHWPRGQPLDALLDYREFSVAIPFLNRSYTSDGTARLEHLQISFYVNGKQISRYFERPAVDFELEHPSLIKVITIEMERPIIF